MLRFLSISLAAGLVVMTGYLLPRADERQQLESVISIAVAVPANAAVPAGESSTDQNDTSTLDGTRDGSTQDRAGATKLAARPMTELERRFAELNGLIAANKGSAATYGSRSPILMPVALRNSVRRAEPAGIREDTTEADQRARLAAAERELAQLAANGGSSGANQAANEDPNAKYELARNLQRELRRVGCYRGRIDGVWGRGSIGAMERFNQAMRADLPGEEPHQLLLSIVSQQENLICGTRCEAGSEPDSYGRCVSSRSEQIADASSGSSNDNPWKASTVRVAVSRTTSSNQTSDANRYASLNSAPLTTYNVNGISQVQRVEPRVINTRPAAQPSRARAERAVKSKPRYSLGSAPNVVKQKKYSRSVSSRSSNWKKAVFNPR